MFGQKLTGEISYEMSVPSKPNFNTHGGDYLARINTVGWEKFLLEAMDEKEKFWITEEVLLSRNKSPHRLWGLLLWDCSSNNIFALDKEKQVRFFRIIKKIEKILRDKYGKNYYILVWMCLSEEPGLWKRQSINYTHAHISLIPKAMPTSKWEETEDNGVKIKKPYKTKTLKWAQFKIRNKTLRIMEAFGQVTEFETGIVWESKNHNHDIQFPESLQIDNSDIQAILKANSTEWVEVGSTISVIVNNLKTRIAISLWTPGYLHFDWIELQRENVENWRWTRFDNFGKKIFQEVCIEMQTI